MKSFVMCCFLVLAACGEKRNLDRCCVDEADCAAIGLPNGSTCQPGELCRGNECVEQRCTVSSECDLAAPYCEDQHCAEMCSSDSSCPGAAQMNQPFCVSGACVQCREGMNDCGDLVCRNGKCGSCAADGECPSGLCLFFEGGVCASTTDVAFVSPNGSPTSNCTKAAPCTLVRALSIDPTRSSIKLAAGTYQNAATLTVEGKRTFSGEDPDMTRITNMGTGPVFVIGSSSEVTFERLQVFGAKNGAEPGEGVRCLATTTKLRMSEVSLFQNASHGVETFCDFAATRSTMSANGGFGVMAYGEAFGAKYLIERSKVFGNTGGGISASGAGMVRSSFVFRNQGVGIYADSFVDSRPQVEFTTVADNVGGGFRCIPLNNTQIPVTNVLLYRNINDNPVIGLNMRVCAFSNCVFDGTNEPGCQQRFDIGLVSPNSEPYDYHLVGFQGAAGVDAASGGAGTLDYDGETRPKGSAADIGADEAF